MAPSFSFNPLKSLPFFLGLLFCLGTSGCGQAPPIASNHPAKNETRDIYLSKTVIIQTPIQSFQVTTEPVVDEVVTTGEIKANENTLFFINPIVTGRIVEDRLQLGDTVQAGQTVAVIQSAEVTQINARFKQQLHENQVEINQAKTHYTLAKRAYDREKRLFKVGISPEKDFLQSESDLILAKSNLDHAHERALHIRSEATALLSTYGSRPDFESEQLSTTSPIKALRSGVVTKKNVTLGSVVSPSQTLYEVSDLGELWLDITLYANQIGSIEKNQSVVFKADSFPTKAFKGHIDYIQPISNQPSQTFTARVFIPNPHQALKPGMMGEIHIQKNLHLQKPFIPHHALQSYGKESFVFIDLGQGHYQKRRVEVGSASPTGVWIIQGLKAGENIVGQGSFTLKAAWLKEAEGEPS